MMRLRVLALPTPDSTSRVPFALVIDRCPPEALEYLRDVDKAAVGAEGILAFAEEVDLESGA